MTLMDCEARFVVIRFFGRSATWLHAAPKSCCRSLTNICCAAGCLFAQVAVRTVGTGSAYSDAMRACVRRLQELSPPQHCF